MTGAPGEATTNSSAVVESTVTGPQTPSAPVVFLNAAAPILLVEQKLTIALKISHRLYVMGHGKIVWEGAPAALAAASAVRKEWLEV